MNKREPPSREAFDKLLAWLDPDREKAGEKYHRIQTRLIRIFAAKGYCDAEDLTDVTINVVAQKIDWLTENYEGDPALFFLGVARKIFLERCHEKPPPKVPPPDPPSDEVEKQCSCLDECLKESLSTDERTLVLRYHPAEKKLTISTRKQLATELGISSNALRIRVYHIHSRLRGCIDRCLKALPES